MARLEVPYGRDGRQVVEIPDGNLRGLIYPNEVQASDGLGAVLDAIDNPINSPSLEEFLRGAEDVLVIINDGTRPTPTSIVIDGLSRRMNLAFPRFLVATGTHRAPTEEEYRFMLGKYHATVRPSTVSHDSQRDRMSYLGRSKNGTEIWINERVMEADRVIVITSVEPHYFAGYTGGRKSFLPGVASYQSVEQNHRLAMRPEAQSLVLEGNPVHEDMMDALRMLGRKPIFSIQMVLDRHHNIYRVAAGHIVDAFEGAVGWANEAFSVRIKEKADVVITVAPYPMDVDLYQSQKALDNGKWALKEGGIMILVSKCREGVGHRTFLEQLSLAENPREVLDNLTKGYRLGFHKAAKMAEIATWAEMWGVTDLDPGLLRKAKINPFDSLQSAIDTALSRRKDASVLVLMDGSVTVPRVD